MEDFIKQKLRAFKYNISKLINIVLKVIKFLSDLYEKTTHCKKK